MFKELLLSSLLVAIISAASLPADFYKDEHSGFKEHGEHGGYKEHGGHGEYDGHGGYKEHGGHGEYDGHGGYDHKRIRRDFEGVGHINTGRISGVTHGAGGFGVGKFQAQGYDTGFKGVGSDFGVHGFGGVVSDQSHLSESAIGSSAGVIGGSSNFESGNLSKKSSSKSSSSESNKNSRIKTGSSFGAGNQNIAANTYDASKASNLDYGASASRGVGHFGGVEQSQVGLSKNDASSISQGSLVAGSGYIGGATNTEIEQSESNKHSEAEANDEVQQSYQKGNSNFGAGYQDQYARNKDASRGFNYGNNGFIAASNDRLSSSSQGSFVGEAAGSTNQLLGKVSRVSSSKSSSSESNKRSRIKTGTNFNAGNQKIAANAYDASKTSQLNYGASGSIEGGSTNVGLSAKDASSVSEKSLDAASNLYQGSSNTEIEQSESNKQSQTETNENVEGTFGNSGSQFGAEQQSNFAQNQDQENVGFFGSGAFGFGNVAGGLALDSSRLSSSSRGTSSGKIAGSTGQATGTIHSKASSKSSSSESSKGTKIKTGTNFGYGDANLQAQQFGASQFAGFDFGSVAQGLGGLFGNSNIGISAKGESNQRGQSLTSSLGYLQGVSNTEIEQSESNKHSESETNENSEGSFSGVGSQYDAAGESNIAQNSNADSDSLFISN